MLLYHVDPVRLHALVLHGLLLLVLAVLAVPQLLLTVEQLVLWYDKGVLEDRIGSLVSQAVHPTRIVSLRTVLNSKTLNLDIQKLVLW